MLLLEIDDVRRLDTEIVFMKIFLRIMHPFIFYCLFIMSGCKAQPQNLITGNIKLHPEWKPVVYLIQPRHFSEIAADFLGTVVDSAMISADGTFSFEHIPHESKPLLLQVVVQKTGSRFANHLMDSIPARSNYMPIILAVENPIRINADISAFQKSFEFVNPSLENQSMISLRNIRMAAFEKFLATETYRTNDDSIIIEKENAYLNYTKALAGFADTTKYMQAAVTAIRWISPVGDFERIPEFIVHQCQKWQYEQTGNSFTAQLCAAANKNILPVLTGDQIPDYTLPLISGDSINLFKLLGRRLTILDLWASWCAPCRKENRSILNQLWSAYSTHDLQIIGYSIDNDEKAWKSAIQDDHTLWPQSSHLTGDDTPFLHVLRITTIPANFILDPQGKIIAKNLHGEELIEFVHNYLD